MAIDRATVRPSATRHAPRRRRIRWPRESPPALRRAAGPLAIGLAAAAWIGSAAATPSFWGDEAASVMSAQRSLPSLARELAEIDAVHGIYYLALHAWIAVGGVSEGWVRLPSVIAAGVAVAATAVLARRLFGEAIGLASAAVLALLPPFERIATEARSYSTTIAGAVLLTLLLVTLLDRERPGRRWWALYAVGIGVLCWLWVFAALLLPVHAALVVLLGRRRAAAWAISGACGVLLAAPLGALAIAQRAQLAHLSMTPGAAPKTVAVTQWFGADALAVCAAVLVAAAGIAAVRSTRTVRRRAAAIAIWVVAPTAILLIASIVVPVYTPRYASISLPAVAIAIGAGAVAIVRAVMTRRRMAGVTAAALVAVLLVATAMPRLTLQRGRFGAQGGADLRQTALALAHRASPGDAVVFDEAARPSQRPRVILHLYAGMLPELDDVQLRTPFTERAGIWDSAWPVLAVPDRLAGHRTVWAVEVAGSGSDDLDALRGAGFTVTGQHVVHRSTIYRFDRIDALAG